ncbi:retinitis pigmentosa 1-like 1 protein [Mastacembelus armatus]|uniref:retinitis pigmentosa 1-like 1 protein n=1 Tax=Mastacembelus armatus TaxID=205130 RepID=UPI000E45CC8B|nr:retinitis pigmentosa 1-like 1 protein [Mastacembelus armatus]
MSTNKRSFQCFNTVGGEDAHRSSASFKHHTSHLPRIPRHGMVGHHEPLEECYLCSEYRHAQAWDALETQVSPLYHTHTPHHHHHPHRYVHSGATEPEAAHSGQDHHIHHHRYNKRMMLVKNSDPSLRKTIILHRRNLRSFGLFLEEVSELMQYHIRKLYTLDGHKIDNVQSLMQCPSVLVCVGREPSHPSIVESFRKTSDDTLPKLSMRSRVSGCTEGQGVNQGLPMKKSAINPKTDKVTDNRRSASSDKSLPDGTDSPDHVDSYPPTGEGIGDDDIEKRVRVNKDGSLSMEMKVRFRLQNDETLHWSTEVRKSTGKTPERSFESPTGENHKEQTDERAASSRSVRSVRSHATETSIKTQASDVPADNVAEHVKTAERTSSALSAKSAKSHCSATPTKSVCSGEATAISDEGNSEEEEESQERVQSAMSAKSTQSVMSTTSNKSKISDVPAEEYFSEQDKTVERAASAMSDRSAKSNTSTLSHRSKGPFPVEGNTEEENGERAPSCMSVNEETVERVSSAMSAKSNDSGISAKHSNAEDETEERSQSNMSAKSNTSVSSRSTMARDVPSEENAANEKKTVQRPLSTLSAKSARSAKSSKSSKSKASHAKDEENREDMERAPSNTSNKSAKSGQSNVTGVSMKSKASKVPSEDGVSITENEEETETSAKSSVSAKSVRSNMSGTTAGITKDKSERAPRTTSANSTMSLRSKTSKSDTLSRSEVPAVTVEETEDRVPTVMSSKSKVSARSRKSGAKEKTSEGWSQSSLSVKSNLSMKSRKSKETNTLTDEQVENKEEMKISTEGPAKQKTTVVNTDAKNKSTSDLHEEEKPEPVDKRSCHSKTSSSSRQNSKNATAEIIAKPISASSDTCQGAQQPKGNNRHVISHTESNESDLSLTTYNSDVVEKLHESTGTGESKSNVSKKKKSGPLEATDTGRRVTDNKSDNSSKCRHKTTDADDFELAPSSLPNASPTEVVNEWLKTIPTDSDMFDMEEFNENYDVQETGHTTEEIKGMDANENNVESATESTKDTEEEVMNSVPNNDCQTSTEAPNEDNTEQDDASKMFHSSVQVMKVLLNPKLDRCNSLPEISPVYGRKLSTSARGLLDCLVKLQLIDHDPKNANEKDERYQELMNILQSLWLCDRPESEHVLKEDQHHFLDDEFNHTSSSGVDVNSGSTVSGKSSDGVNCDVSQPHTAANALMTVQEVLEADTQWTHEREVEGMDEKNQKEDDPATDDTIRSNDSPRELPETPFSSNNSSENEGNGQNLPEEAEAECQDDTSSESPPLIHSAQLVKMISQDPNPVWVLTLLTKIEKQFMTHYINAMREFKARWNLVDDEQLDMMISELKTEVHKRIQTSIDRELRKLQGRAGLPRPPKETMSRTSTTQTVDRRRKLKIMLNQLTDPHAEKSDDSDTSYSDQRNENDVEYCPCETCIKNEPTSRTPGPVPTSINCTSQSENDTETKAVETFVEKVIVKAVREVEGGEVHQATEDDTAVATHDEEADDMCQNAGQDNGSENNDKDDKDTIKELTDKEEVLEMGTVTEGGETDAIAKDESAESMKATLNEDTFTVADKDEANKRWLTMKKILLPPVKMILQYKMRTQQLKNTNENDTTAEDQLNEPTEQAKTEEEIYGKKETADTRKDDSKEETAEDNVTENVNVADDKDEETAEKTSMEDEISEEKEIAVTGEGEMVEEAGASMDEEDDTAEDVAETTEHESDEEEVVEGGTTEGATDEDEKILATGVDENVVMVKGDEQSKEETTTEDELADKDEAMEAGTADEETNEDEMKVDVTEATTAKNAGDDETFTGKDESEKEDAAEEGMINDGETAVTTEDESMGDEIVEKSTVAATTDNDSDNEEAMKTEIADNGEESGAASEDDSADDDDENEVSENATGPLTEEATTEDELVSEKEAAVTSEDGEYELKEDAAEDATAENGDAEHSNTAATSEDETDQEEAVEKQIGSYKEELPSTTADESNDTTTAGEEEKADTEDEMAVDKDINRENDSKEETAEDETVSGTTEKDSDKEETVEAGIVDDEEDTVAASDNDSAEGTITNEDETVEGNTAAGDELSKEPDVAVTTEDETDIEKETDVISEDESKKELAEAEDENTLKESDVAATTEDESDRDEAETTDDGEQTAATNKEDEIADTNKAGTPDNESAIEKDIAVSSEDEAEDSAAEDRKDAAATNKYESDEYSAVEKDILVPSELDENETAEKTSMEDEISEEKEIAVTGEDEMVEEADETAEEDKTEPSKKNAESSATKDSFEEEEKDDDEDVKSHSGKLVRSETTEEESEEAENESSRESGATGEDCTESATTGDETEEHKTAEPEKHVITRKGTSQSDSVEESGAGGTSAGEEDGDNTEDESAQDDKLQLTRGENEEVEENAISESDTNPDRANGTPCECIDISNGSHHNVKDTVETFEKEEETETPNEDWSEAQGDSADGEDEAEEDSDEPEEETDDGEQDFVPSKTDKQKACNRAAEVTMLIPFSTLTKVNAESEDGAYADVEDSDTELNSQDDVTSLESKSLKKVS